MRITFALKEFFRDRRSNSAQVNHFLVADARVEVTLVFADSSRKVFVPSKGPNGRFVLDVSPADVPDNVDASAPPVKHRISSLSLDFTVPFSHGGKTFNLLRILQDFSLTERPANDDQTIDYTLSPFSWKHSSSTNNPLPSASRTTNARTHPLLDLTHLSRDLVLINTLVLDITGLWEKLHEGNRYYRMYESLGAHDRVTLKVLAHTGGNSFIWYSVIPAYLAESSKVSPHVFFSPADYAEKQNVENERKYLLDNGRHFQNVSGSTLIDGYLLPPIDDDKIQELNPLPELDPAALPTLGARAAEPGRLDFAGVDAAMDQMRERVIRDASRRSRLIQWVIQNRRNVVNFSYTSSRPPDIQPRHWSIGAGFEKAFYGLGEVQPQQFLLMPQPYGRGGVIKGRESDRHLKTVTDTIVDLLLTNTHLIGLAPDHLVAKDKMVISCYSESGWDLWKTSATNMDHIKAIIGIEPNSVNPKGRDIIPHLLKKQIKVYIIGRHKGFGNHYRPEIGKHLQQKIRFLPDDPLKILKYPPDPDTNDFVKYRVGRVTDVDLDPLMLPSEKKVLEDLAKRRKPVKGKAAIPFVLKPINNSDKLSQAALTSIFYTHNFALTGGQDMTLSDPDNFYDKPVTYRTFFQQAVEEIG